MTLMCDAGTGKPNLPTPKPVIPGLPPFFINPCMLNPSLCDDGTGIA